jgi:hypothetical protein
MIYELRQYSIKYGGDYLSLFKEYVVPHLEECGFKLLGAWMTYIGSGVRSDFFWLLQWEGLAQREAANDKLRAQPWYGEFGKLGAPHIAANQIRFLEPVDFSPLA